MNNKSDPHVRCRHARKGFSALFNNSRKGPGEGGIRPQPAECTALQAHIRECGKCAAEYELFRLERLVLEHAAAPEPVRPDEAFFVRLRASLERGPASDRTAPVELPDESWAAAVMLTARQLFPAMATLLLLLILGATFMSSQSARQRETVANTLSASERILYNDLYDYPDANAADVLETLVAVDEKENGK